MKQATLIVIVGPTAVGKTAVAIAIAKKLACEVISADSRQFYKEMSIGTAKPTLEEMDGVPHHFVGHLSIHDEYSAGKFEQEALQKLKELFQNNNNVVLVGGSGLFVNALCYGLDEIPSVTPEIREKVLTAYQEKGLGFLQQKVQEVDPVSFAKMDIQNPQRLMRVLEVYENCGTPLSSFQNKRAVERNFKCVWIGLDMDRSILYERINNRVDKMMQEGLLEEVQSLLAFKSLNPLKTVGYQEFFEAFENNESIDSAVEKVKQNSRRYAKRQLTWFRRNEEISWFSPKQIPEILKKLNF